MCWQVVKLKDFVECLLTPKAKGSVENVSQWHLFGCEKKKQTCGDKLQKPLELNKERKLL